MKNEDEKIIIEAILTAGKEIKRQFGVMPCSEISKVTEFDYGIAADKESEKIILDAIKKTSLHCQIVSEEAGTVGNTDSDWTAFVDPLDGTVNYSKGIPTYAIGVGIFYKSKPVFGAIYDPSLDELFIANKEGITLNGKPIKTNNNGQNLLINLEWFGAANYIDIITKFRSSHIRARTMGSGILSLLYGVIGRGNGAVLLENKPWDIAPGYVFASFLNCKIVQLDGSPIDLNLPALSIIAAPYEVFSSINSAFNHN